MRPLNRLKVPFGIAKFCRVRNARYLTWRDAFEVEFEDGIAFLETHQADPQSKQDQAQRIARSSEA